MVAKLRYVTEHYLEVKLRASPGDPGRQHRQDAGVVAAGSSSSGLMTVRDGLLQKAEFS
jgi:hypothetical protein